LYAGLDELIEEVRVNHESEHIGKLCQVKGNNISYVFFKSAHEIQPIIDKFHILYNKYQNQFFLHFLKQTLKASASLSLATFVADVWDSVYSQCLSLVETIKHKKIKLKDVPKVFEYLRKKEDMPMQLHKLHSALEECQNRLSSPLPPQWINDSIVHMNCYLSLCKQSQAATLILELKGKLGLTGDFSLVEGVAKQVASSTCDEPLSSIDKSLVDSALSFFGELSLSSNSEKYDCILAFTKCNAIVQWIQKETKGIALW